MTEEEQGKKAVKSPAESKESKTAFVLSDFLEAAEAYRARGQHDQAIAITREYLGEHPQALALRLFLGRCFLEKEMESEAKAELEKVVQGIEECLPAYRLLSQVYLKEKDVDKAFEAVRKALFFSSGEDPSSKRVTPLEMGLLQKSPHPPFVTPPIQIEEVGGAKESPAEEGSRRTPIQTDTLAEIYSKQGHWQKALAIYREILAREPQNPVWREKVETLQHKIVGAGKKQGRLKALARLEAWLRAVEQKVPAAGA